MNAPRLFLSLALALLGPLWTQARQPTPELRVSPLFSENACLQADTPLKVWGWAQPREKVEVTLGQGKASATANVEGRWQVELPAVTVGGPYVLTVKGAQQTIESKNILAGQVWLASGQSNMQWPMERAEETKKDIPQAQAPELRLFRVEVEPSYQLAREPNGRWEICTPETAASFSSVAYYFGRKLQRELGGTPVGLIQSAKGGTPIEGWLPMGIWKENTELERIYQNQLKLGDDHMRKTYERLHKKWLSGGKKGTEPAAPNYNLVDQNDPSVCFNVGIVPLIPYPIAGVLWYQGEWNTSRASEYDDLLTRLIVEWRQLWQNEELPFYVVQLPNITKAKTSVVEPDSGWAALREAQTVVRQIPHTGLVVTIDVGGDLHPGRKQPVGERLARLALAKTYGKDIPAEGPILEKNEIIDGKIRLTFREANGLTLRSTPNTGTGFAVAGVDRVFHPAEAEVSDMAIILSSPAVPAPLHVRYLWANDPSPTVFNAADLPAGPFRTDDWTEVSVAPPSK